MTRLFVILGAGGFAREARDILDARGKKLHAFVVDADFVPQGGFLDDVPVHDFDWLRNETSPVAVLGVGDPKLRRRFVERLVLDEIPLAESFQHPSVTRGRNLTFGDGSLFAAGVSLTNNIHIGKAVLLNLHVTVGHDASIGDYAALMPGVHVSGGVVIETGAYLGTGACVLGNVRVGAWSRVGAGAVVTRDVLPNTTVMGVPARVSPVCGEV